MRHHSLHNYILMNVLTELPLQLGGFCIICRCVLFMSFLFPSYTFQRMDLKKKKIKKDSKEKKKKEILHKIFLICSRLKALRIDFLREGQTLECRLTKFESKDLQLIEFQT